MSNPSRAACRPTAPADHVAAVSIHEDIPIVQSTREESNLRPVPYQGTALATELQVVRRGSPVRTAPVVNQSIRSSLAKDHCSPQGRTIVTKPLVSDSNGGLPVFSRALYPLSEPAE